ncbi:MAG: ornithine carbamoyltransferase [Candidatus Omnitrophota bacterium]|nr:MAG: ornithine carbamoyltransferase [Candidatus Omnitrophota bacterium]
MSRSLLTLNDISPKELHQIFKKAKTFKAKIKEHKVINTLQGRVVGLFFEKPSTRTRVSFETAVARLGGKTVYLPSGESQQSRGESIKDIAQTLGSYLDALVARVYIHKTVEELARYAGIPVINGLSDLTHPTQIICDLFTILEIKQKLKGLTLAYIGDGNNICCSLFMGAAMTGMNMTAACPEGYHPNKDIFRNAEQIAEKTKAKLKIVENPKDAAKDADILYTDVWVSMGQEKEREKRLKAFEGYQINADILKLAKKKASVMHCLPAYKGLEITEDIIEGPQSIIWQQAENKIYGAAAVLDFILQ